MGHQLSDAYPLLRREVEGDVTRTFASELLKDFATGSTQHLVNTVDLVYLVASRKQRIQGRDLEHNAAGAPQIHLRAVVSVRKEALWGAVPPCGDILRVWLLTINTSAATKVGQFQSLAHFRTRLYQNIFWFDIPMEYTLLMHMVKCLHQLPHIAFNKLGVKIVPPTTDELVKVRIH